MAKYTQYRRRGLGDRLGRAVAGVLVGIVMFLASFGVLWWNEGRTDMSKVAEGATVASAEQVDESHNGTLVSVSGTLKPQGTVSDPAYLAPGNYLRLNREVQMYAWVERTRTETETELGGSEIEKTTFEYEKEWTSHPADSSGFEYEYGHENPQKTIDDKTFHATSASVGTRTFDPAEAGLPPADDLTLTKKNVRIQNKKQRRRAKISDQYIFLGRGSLERPVVGDMRISYRAVPAGLGVTMFGQQDTASLVPYMHDGKDKLFRAVVGTHEEAISQMATEHTVMSWILRITGFLMMWIGMSLVFGPLHTMMDIIPVIGQGSRFLVGVALFPVALVLAILTSVISMIAHSPIALILTLLVLVGGGVAFYVIRKRRMPATPEPAAA